MQKDQSSTTAQLRADAHKTRKHAETPDPAASPLGTDFEAAGCLPPADRAERAREAERKLRTAKGRDGASNNGGIESSSDQAQLQRGSHAPYAKEDHMNGELMERVEAERELKDVSS